MIRFEQMRESSGSLKTISTSESFKSLRSHYIIISSLVGPSALDKYSYEIRRSFADPLTVHSLDPSIESSRTKEVVFIFIFQSEVIL